MLIRIETTAGHGAGKPTAKLIEEVADRVGVPGEEPEDEIALSLKREGGEGEAPAEPGRARLLPSRGGRGSCRAGEGEAPAEPGRARLLPSRGGRGSCRAGEGEAPAEPRASGSAGASPSQSISSHSPNEHSRDAPRKRYPFERAPAALRLQVLAPNRRRPRRFSTVSDPTYPGSSRPYILARVRIDECPGFARADGRDALGREALLDEQPGDERRRRCRGAAGPRCRVPSRRACAAHGRWPDSPPCRRAAPASMAARSPGLRSGGFICIHGGFGP